jgi:hypothetical protein
MYLGVLDKLLTYSIKSLIRAFRRQQSVKWERTRALVTGAIVVNPLWGCSSVRLHYKYDLDGQSTKGSDIVPFLALWKAREYADSFPHNLPRVVRVDPNDTRNTRYFDIDQ